VEVGFQSNVAQLLAARHQYLFYVFGSRILPFRGIKIGTPSTIGYATAISPLMSSDVAQFNLHRMPGVSMQIRIPQPSIGMEW